MQTINFNDQTLLADDPTIVTKDNSLAFTGAIAADPLNLLNGLALTQDLLLQPISWTFAAPVDEVSFKADIVNLLGSATVNYYDSQGDLLHSTNSTGIGEQTFTYSNPDIAQVQITGTGLNALTIDDISYQDATSMVSTVANPTSNPLISGQKWTSSHLTYSAPASAGEYTSEGYKTVSGFQQMNGGETSEVQQIMAGISGETGLTLTQTTNSGANVRFGEASSIDTGDGSGAHTVAGSTVYGLGSTSSDAVGDVWLQAGSTVTQLELMKDIGQALGLQAGSLGGTHDSIAYSVMSNDTYPGGSPSDLSTVDAPSTLMQDDIAALQAMYGANFNVNSSDTVYKWDPTTGEEFINGVGQGAPADGKVFMTLWDGGGKDTLDFSAYTGNVHIDLRPGDWTSATQLQSANLGDGHTAPGNIAMAQLYEGNTQSLIENANGGSGNDSIIGNQVANVLNGEAGNDTLQGGSGNDALYGAAGNDVLYGNTGNDKLVGGAGADVLFGGNGHDGLVGGAGHDVLHGGGSYDVLRGGGGRDALYGDSGNDRLDGGGGADILVGGSGDDTYIYGRTSDSDGTSFDTVVRFNTMHDKFQLWFAVTGIDQKDSGSLSAGSFDSDLTKAMGNLEAHHAELFKATSGTDAWVIRRSSSSTRMAKRAIRRAATW